MVKDVQSTTGLEDSMLPNLWKAFICNHTSIVAPKSTCRDKQGTLAGANRDFWDRNSVMRLCPENWGCPKVCPKFCHFMICCWENYDKPQDFWVPCFQFQTNSYSFNGCMCCEIAAVILATRQQIGQDGNHHLRLPAMSQVQSTQGSLVVEPFLHRTGVQNPG